MTDNSKMLYERGKKFLPLSVNSPIRFFDPYPFFVKSGKGSKIITEDNKVMVDYCMGYGSLLLGHAPDFVIDSIKSQLGKGSLFCMPTEKEIELAELLNKLVPMAEMSRLTNTGAEATMTAIRLARAYTKKNKILKFDGCYHGAYDYVLANSGSGAGNLHLSQGLMKESISQTISVKYNDIESVKEQIKEDKDIACVIVEPVAANMGLILPEQNFLQNLRTVTKDEGIVLIFDEVITGFRLSAGGASEYFGIKPDLITFSKALGAGFPLSAVCGRKEIVEMLAPSGKVYQASTYAGNPISVTAGAELLNYIYQQKDIIYPSLSKLCDQLANGIRDSINELKIDCQINSIGSLFQIFFNPTVPRNFEEVKKSDMQKFRKFFENLLDSNIFIPPSQLETCFLSLSHTEEDIDITIDAIASVLKKINC